MTEKSVLVLWVTMEGHRSLDSLLIVHGPFRGGGNRSTHFLDGNNTELAIALSSFLLGPVLIFKNAVSHVPALTSMSWHCLIY